MNAPGPGPGRRSPWAAIAVTATGSVLLTVAGALVAALVLSLLFWQLIVNMVLVVFVQELRWYGPGVYTAGGELWWWVFGFALAGTATLILGASMLTRAGSKFPRLRRRRGRPPPPLGPPTPPTGW